MSHPFHVHPERRYQDPDTLARKSDRRLPLDLECLPPLAQVRRKRASTLNSMPSMHTSPSPIAREFHPARQFDLASWFVLIVTNPICPIQHPSYASRGCPTRNTVMTMRDVQFTCVPRRALRLPPHLSLSDAFELT